ncbi:MAG: hypothetical protein BWY83_01491 [bacterium ADurb.Bin478]|nr:MAG: hypothetical protein BWY83_01491 [bacterium ADurb.Bin478]
MGLDKTAQHLILLAARQIGHVGGDQMVAVAENAKGGGQSLGSHAQLFGAVIAAASSGQSRFNHRGQFGEIVFINGLDLLLGMDEAAIGDGVVKEFVELIHQIALIRRQGFPFRQRNANLESAAGDIQRRQGLQHRGRIEFPGGQGQIKRRQLGAARIDLQPEKVVAQNRMRRFNSGEPLFGPAHGDQALKQRNQKVTGAAAEVQAFQLSRPVGPLRKTSGHGRAIRSPAQILEM